MAVNNNKLVLLTFAICRLIVTVGLTVVPELLDVGLQGRLSVDTLELEAASVDFGRLSRGEPSEVVTTRKVLFYDALFKSVIWNRLKKWCGGKLVIIKLRIIFYNVNSKAVIKNRLRICQGGIFVIIRKNSTTGFERTAFALFP